MLLLLDKYGESEKIFEIDVEDKRKHYYYEPWEYIYVIFIYHALGILVLTRHDKVVRKEIR